MSCNIKYNTGNPLCSSDPRDLSDNAQIIDSYVNSEELTQNDRFGMPRKTLAGIEAEAQDKIDSFEQMIDDKIIAQGGVEIAQEWGDSPNKTLSQEFLTAMNKSKIVTPYDFDGVGDGITDDTLAIQKAIDSGKIVYIPKTENGWRISRQKTYSETDWGYSLILKDNTKIIGNGEIHCEGAFSTRCVMLLIRGSGISISGITLKGSYTSGSSWVVGIGGGSTYDYESPDSMYDLIVQECRFINCWIGVSMQYNDKHKSGYSFKRAVVDGCYCEAWNQSTAGNYNFRKEGNCSISDIVITNSFAKGGKTASSFNFVGVFNIKLSNIISEDNLYAGVEIENGCYNVDISNFTSINDYYGVWIDDSSFVNVSNVTGVYDKEITTAPLHPNRGIVGKVINITKQYQVFMSNYTMSAINIDNVVGKNASIALTNFGQSAISDYSLDGVSINNFKTYFDAGLDTNRSLLMTSSNTSNVVLTNIYIKGGSEISLSINNWVNISELNAPDTALMTSGSTGHLKLVDVKVKSTSFNHSRVDIYRNFSINNVIQYDIDGNRITYAIGADSTDVVARQGSLLTTKDGKLYVKMYNTGSSGWVEK